MRKRADRPRRSSAFELAQLPLQQLQNPYRPIEVLDAESLDMIHDGSMRILEQIGLQIMSEPARRLMQQQGATIDAHTGHVLMERELVMEKIASVPAQFTLYGRNPKYRSTYGTNHINFTLVASPPNCSDLERGRRTGNYADYCDFLRLGQTFNVIAAHSGYPVEPIDLPAHNRHLDAYLAFIELTEKPWAVYCLGNGKVEDGLEMVRLARGIDWDELKQRPGIMTVVNTNSPLKVDKSMLAGLMLMAEMGQPVVVTPFTLAGAMSPVTLAGALAQQNAEALGVIALTQMVNPGAPVMYGGFTSNVDMKSGAPAFGTPEYAKAVLAGGQLARRYRIPYRTSNVNAANTPDAQAAWESQNSLWSAVMGYGNMIKHSGGWLEGGLCASFEKLIIDVELMQMMVQFLQPIKVGEQELAIETIKSVGAGGHFFGTEHTIERYKTAFYAPLVADWSNFETWQEKGEKTAAQRAHLLYKKILEQYTPPELDPAIRESLHDYAAKRRRQLRPEW